MLIFVVLCIHILGIHFVIFEMTSIFIISLIHIIFVTTAVIKLCALSKYNPPPLHLGQCHPYPCESYWLSDARFGIDGSLCHAVSHIWIIFFCRSCRSRSNKTIHILRILQNDQYSRNAFWQILWMVCGLDDLWVSCINRWRLLIWYMWGWMDCRNRVCCM